MATTAAIAGVLIAAGGTAYSIKNAPGAPSAPPPTPPAPAPPPPPPVPPAPTMTEMDTGVSDARARLKRQRGIASTIYTSPLGIASPSQTLGG
jgi:hypothetical protein